MRGDMEMFTTRTGSLGLRTIRANEPARGPISQPARGPSWPVSRGRIVEEAELYGVAKPQKYR